MFKLAGISDELIVTVHKVGYRFEPIVEKTDMTDSHKTSKNTLFKWLEIGLILALLISLLFSTKQLFNPQTKNTEVASYDEAIITKQSTAEVTQIYILRHTEKADDNAEDPELSTQGIAHALYWRSVLQHTPFDQVFTTDFKRNIQTANLLTTESSIRPELYYPMSFDVLKFINQIRGQRVLIIGHSNTIPDMVNRLIGETIYPPMSHDNYDVLFIVTINKNGDTSSSMLHIQQP
jgi:broad specificity phosphatase PhoE